MLYIGVNIIINQPKLVVYCKSVKLKINILLFANLKEIAKQSSLQLDVPETSTVRDIIAILKKEIPNITPYFESLMIAVNMTYVENTYKLNNNDEIALIPPASGG